ncbi:shikimate dehydrogenase [Paenibacillus sp. P96]|uniref:Shikimate dehydrogenase (NADP(+)) n=2 Tax=Paenibacillus zeirhizosphaerae TaxID=2987519 RepID=A0ABT9FTX1_9BACL|nr:shikimate dehydrogenase [Paenibacillus sp. P96]MDP4098109.1 shikimate dehydrogenase [Paenibacillus sp. P96]
MSTANHTKDKGPVLLGVIGDPIAHSKSPVMMAAAFGAAGIAGEYRRLHVKSDQLEETLRDIRGQGFLGINVTIPHKVAVMDYLDELDESAKKIGAVNTIVHANGKLKGYNTDGAGYVRSLREEAVSDLTGKTVMLLGAGGASRGIVYALLQERPKRVIIVNRTEDKARQLAGEYSAEIPVEGYSMEQARELLLGVDILINTTSVGMHPQTEDIPLPVDIIPEGIVVSDLIYNPLETKLLRESRLLRGCKVHGGLGMFVYQGAIAFEYWLGFRPDVQVMRQAVLDSLT